MAIRNNLNSRLDRMADDGSQTYGRASMIRKQVQRELPTDLVFADECTNDVFQLSYNGATQFLRKMGISTAKENVEWLIDGLLNTSIDDSFPIETDNGYADLVISCRCPYDPQGRSLAQMGIAKSMVFKEPVMPPQQHRMMQKMDGVGSAPMTEAQRYMRKIGMPVGDGVGVLFGRDVLELRNAMKKGLAGQDGFYTSHDETGDVGGMLGQCNVSGSHRITKMRGWQE